MLFNSYEFIFLFFPVVALVFFALGRRPALAAGWLALASVFFYGWWTPKALPILLGSVAMNYAFSHRVLPQGGASERARRWWLRAALAANLVLLGFFKYANFFIENVNAGLAASGASPIPALHVMLPIGISFFTFTQIAFIVDCWSGKVVERNAVHYLLFVTYFPHLIAGPVLHHAQMMPQFAQAQTYRVDVRKIVPGITVFVIGLSKKLLLADPLGQYADFVFGAVDKGQAPGLWMSWLGTLSYTFQIYFDFSGYSDMAIGLALILGVTLPINFDSPYKATSIIEFWRRWHISLSTFLRDYLYIPLGGNRAGRVRRYLNLFTTMLLGGLWHGASWTFVLWGAAHGVLLIANHAWRFVAGEPSGSRTARVAGWALTFVAVCFTWLLFRAGSLDTAVAMMRGMLGLNGAALPIFARMELPYKEATLGKYLLVSLFICTALPSSNAAGRYVPLFLASAKAARWPRWQVVGSALAVVLAFGWSISRLGHHSPFLYFQF
ncbi:MAG: MBOAT family protein [Rhizobacter sp.]|nr:MBOAT family protein [Rhizobacter sp.]